MMTTNCSLIPRPAMICCSLQEFSGTEINAREGDVLYLPPGVAHWGTARRACMTYSIGMRAPDGKLTSLTHSISRLPKQEFVLSRSGHLNCLKRGSTGLYFAAAARRTRNGAAGCEQMTGVTRYRSRTWAIRDTKQRLAKA